MKEIRSFVKSASLSELEKAKQLIDTAIEKYTQQQEAKKEVLDLLKEKKILLVQGTAFNWPEPDHLRVVFLPYKDELAKALGDFGEFLDGYKQ